MLFQDFYKGRAFDAYTYFGAHIEGTGVWFRVYAPAAKAVYVIGDFSGWNRIRMDHGYDGGVFTAYVEGAKAGQMYKYLVEEQSGAVREHCDPYGFAMEKRPAFASIITDLYKYRFADEEWMAKRDKCYDKPMNIYELHLASWKTKKQSGNAKREKKCTSRRMRKLQMS